MAPAPAPGHESSWRSPTGDVFWPVDRYLAGLKADAGTPDCPTRETVEAATEFWRRVRQDPRLDVIKNYSPVHGCTRVLAGPSPGREIPWDPRRPVVAVGAGGVVQLAWTDRHRHVDIDFEAGRFSIYALDFLTRRDRYIDDSDGREPLDALFELLLGEL